MVRVALALAMAATMAGAQTLHIYDVPESRSMGGRIGTFAIHVTELRQTNTFVRIQLRTCSSSCTYYLLANAVCVGPRTIFGFHGPQAMGLGTLGVPIRGLSDKEHAETVAIMRADYNSRWPGLGDWFVSSGASDKFGHDFVRVRGAELNRAFGIPIC